MERTGRGYLTSFIDREGWKGIAEPRDCSSSSVLSGWSPPDPEDGLSSVRDEPAQSLRGYAELSSESSRPGNPRDGKKL
jgi:hypothetical protein